MILSIYDSVSANPRPYIESAEDPVEMWTTLDNVQVKSGHPCREQLSIDFRHMKPAPGAPIADYSTHLLGVRNQLASTKQALDDTALF